MADLRKHVHGFALERGLAAVDADNHLVFGAADGGVAVDVGVGAEFLDDIDVHCQALARGNQVEVLRADTQGHRVAGCCLEGCGGHRVDGAAEGDAAVDCRQFQQVHGGGADEACNEDVLRAVVQFARGADLLQQAVLEDRDAVAHGQCLDLVVGHVHGGDTEAAGQRGDLRTGLHAKLGVEVGQRLIHEEDLWATHDRAAHGNTLALAAGECLRLAVKVVLEVQQLCGFLDAACALFLVNAGDLQGEAHVVAHGHVRVQRVVLENHGDVAVLGRNVGDIAVADEDAAGVDVFQACEHAQGGGLATAGRTDQNEEFPVGDFQ